MCNKDNLGKVKRNNISSFDSDHENNQQEKGISVVMEHCPCAQLHMLQSRT